MPLTLVNSGNVGGLTLLSKLSGVQVTAAECKTVVDNFVTRIDYCIKV